MSENRGENRERPPVDKSIDVLDYDTIYRNENWWCAVVLANAFGRKKVFLYLWRMTRGEWKRKQKATLSKQNWNDIKTSVEKFLGRL